jgi:hypothetical protein
MFGKFLDPSGQQGYLHFRRTCIFLVSFELPDNLRSVLICKHRQVKPFPKRVLSHLNNTAAIIRKQGIIGSSLYLCKAFFTKKLPRDVPQKTLVQPPTRPNQPPALMRYYAGNPENR